MGLKDLFGGGKKKEELREKAKEVVTEDGKLTPAAIHSVATSRSDIHFPKPRVVTITQPTETGQVYSIDEIRAISATCRALGLKLHMDGARFAQACAHLGCEPADKEPRESSPAPSAAADRSVSSSS